MKTKTFLLIILIILSCLKIASSYQDAQVTGVKWDNNTLSYNLSRKSPVRVRMGCYAGPVYRTIVNLEKRPKGENRERFDGKDEEDKIDFLKYAKAHFCVDALTDSPKDSILKVTFNSPDSLKDGSVRLDKPVAITINVDNNMKSIFKSQGAELRVYIDNKLNMLEKINSFPFTFNLKADNLSGGRHLVSLNLWTALSHSSVSYKSFEVLMPLQNAAPASKGRIAFSAIDKNGFWQIFTCSLDGKDLLQLTSDSVDKLTPAWPPDGKKIAYVNNLGELWIAELDTNNNYKINLPITCREPSFSPDGKRIIFVSLADVYHGSTKIWEVDLVSLKLEKAVNRPWLQYNPCYSPDGKLIIFTDGPELFGQNILKLDLATRDVTQLTDNRGFSYETQPAFLASGQEIVYSTNEAKGDYEIYKMDKFGRDKINLSKSPHSCDMMPRPSKDGEKIFFLSDRSGKFEIWQMNSDGSEVKQIINNESAVNSFAVYTE